MAEEGTWESIARNGLRSTTALLDLFEIGGPARAEIESEHRPQSKTVTHKIYGSAVIRDQKPLRDSSLNKCLIDLTPAEWYRVLNNQVFFWVTKDRLLTLLSARAYRDRVHCILTVDTKQLLERHLERVKLSPINSGSTLYNPQPRGTGTFFPLSEYPFEERKKKRGLMNAVAELCVDYSVPDISELVTRVAHMEGQRERDVIFER
jgi:hypothetical protein